MVLTEGKAIQVNWLRLAADEPGRSSTPTTNEPVALPAGPTWVALPQQDVDQLVPMAPEVAAELLATRR